MKPIDVVIPTKNSGNTLRYCLNGVKRGINTNRIIIVDNYSQDETLTIAREYNCLVIRSETGLGHRRQLGIEHVETEFFAFVDSDIILGPDWQKIMQGYMRPTVGGVEGYNLPVNPPALKKYVLKTMGNRRLEEVKIGERGNTSNALIRKEAVEGIKIPSNLLLRKKLCDRIVYTSPESFCPFEDHFITQYVLSRGWKWMRAPVFPLHLNPNFAKNAQWVGSGKRIIGVGIANMFKHLTYLVYHGIKSGLEMRNADVMFIDISEGLNYLTGWLKYYKFENTF